MTMNKQINNLIDSLEDDTLDQLEVSVELIELLLVQVDRLQSLAEYHGLTESDYNDHVDRMPKVTIH